MNNYHEPDTDAPDTSKLNEEQLRSRIAELEAQLAQVLDALKPFAMAAKDEDVKGNIGDRALHIRYMPYEFTVITIPDNGDELRVEHLQTALSVYNHLTVKVNSA